MTVIEEIAAERQRQITVEKWSTPHDDEHTRGELATAAGCYALWASNRLDMEPESKGDRGSRWIPKLWPWSAKWWKPNKPRRDLIRAAALIVAEIERLDRLTAMRPSP